MTYENQLIIFEPGIIFHSIQKFLSRTELNVVIITERQLKIRYKIIRKLSPTPVVRGFCAPKSNHDCLLFLIYKNLPSKTINTTYFYIIIIYLFPTFIT